MAFKIPKKAFLSFGRKQCLDTLWRIGKQLDQHWQNLVERKEALKSLISYLEVLTVQPGHQDDYIREQANTLSKKLSHDDQEKMQLWLMHLEREIGLDLKDSDFLVSTSDKNEPPLIETPPIHLVLDNLRSSFNVGSLFRSAEALGVEEIHICGYTPSPENSKTAKSALGTDQWVKWRYWENTLDCLDWLKQKKIKTYAMETEAKAKILSSLTPSFPCALLLGNERYGLGGPVLKSCDQIVQIDLHGRKNSLNVSTCGAIALHHFVTNINGD
jgi:23S rRNA (guanosine2251-2'-O)-methyltransferase